MEIGYDVVEGMKNTEAYDYFILLYLFYFIFVKRAPVAHNIRKRGDDTARLGATKKEKEKNI